MEVTGAVEPLAFMVISVPLETSRVILVPADKLLNSGIDNGEACVKISSPLPTDKN